MTDARTIRGLDAIAERLGRDRETVRRWIERGVLAVRKCGPFQNSPIEATIAELDRITAAYGAGREVE